MTTPERPIDERLRAWMGSRDPGSMPDELRAVVAQLSRGDQAAPKIRTVDRQMIVGPWRTTTSRRHELLLAGAAILVVAVVGVSLLSGRLGLGPDGIGGPASPAVAPSAGLSAAPASGPSASAHPNSPAPAALDDGSGALAPAPAVNRRQIGDVGFSFQAPLGWESFGSEYNHIQKSDRGPQGAEGRIAWATYTGSEAVASPCWYLSQYFVWPRWQKPAEEPRAADIAVAVAEVPGTELITGPTDVIVGGLPAKYVEFVVREDVGCDPGFFFMYETVHGGALWPETVPGDTIRVWIVDIERGPFDRSTLVIEGATHEDAGPRLEQEIHQIVDSVQFQQPN